jgi:periplasmic nitrate reductase NapD
MPHEHHLSSLVVHARPERREEVEERLRSMGCEIHIASGTGKLVVTLEADSARTLGDALTAMQLLDGVLAATLVFHHVESLDGLDEPLLNAQAATEVEP